MHLCFLHVLKLVPYVRRRPVEAQSAFTAEGNLLGAVLPRFQCPGRGARKRLPRSARQVLHEKLRPPEGLPALGTYVAGGLGVLDAVPQEMQPVQEGAATLAAVRAAATVPVAVGDGEGRLPGNGATLAARVQGFGAPPPPAAAAAVRRAAGCGLVTALGLGDPQDDGRMRGHRRGLADHGSGGPRRRGRRHAGGLNSCNGRRPRPRVQVVLDLLPNGSLWFGFALVRLSVSTSTHDVGPVTVLQRSSLWLQSMSVQRGGESSDVLRGRDAAGDQDESRRGHVDRRQQRGVRDDAHFGGHLRAVHQDHVAQQTVLRGEEGLADVAFVGRRRGAAPEDGRGQRLGALGADVGAVEAPVDEHLAAQEADVVARAVLQLRLLAAEALLAHEALEGACHAAAVEQVDLDVLIGPHAARLAHALHHCRGFRVVAGGGGATGRAARAGLGRRIRVGVP